MLRTLKFIAINNEISRHESRKRKLKKEMEPKERLEYLLEVEDFMIEILKEAGEKYR